MALSGKDMANTLIELYKNNDGKKKGKYLLSKNEFKRIAGKLTLKEAYFREVDSFLREDDFSLLDMREENKHIALISLSAMKFEEVAAEEEDEPHSVRCEKLVKRYTNINPMVLKGLMQIDKKFGKKILDRLESYEKKWSCTCFVRFGTVGILAKGKPGNPNYQIESSNKLKIETFRYSHQPFETPDGKFEDRNITEGLSKSDVRDIFNLD